jgi:UDP-N-acetylglucosamine 2-epimerase (non-hydrolysing)
MKIISVVGARPNFMKLAPFCDAVTRHNFNNKEIIQHIIVHTGQHYDANMSDDFFIKLGIPQPDINLEVAASSHAEQVGNTMIKLEKVLLNEKPDWIMVYGDVNATMATAITAKKLWMKIAHVEAGLRSFDNTMPEEINRLVTDRLSDILFTTDEIADRILFDEGTSAEKIFRVGNIMIDSLVKHLPEATKRSLESVVKEFSVKDNAPVTLSERQYALVTLHRPSNVDNKEALRTLLNFMMGDVASIMPIVWPIHPRTRKKMEEFGLWDALVAHKNFVLLSPVGYHEMLRLNMSAKLVFTDSGGLQEESTVLGTPCLTLRWNTERPMTLKEHGGASILVGNDIEKIKEGYRQILEKPISPHSPPLWDGKTAERILDILLKQ